MYIANNGKENYRETKLWMRRSKHVVPVTVVTSAFTDVEDAADCSADTTTPRCRIVPTFSLANGSVPVSLGPAALPAPSPCTAAEAAELFVDAEWTPTFG